MIVTDHLGSHCIARPVPEKHIPREALSRGGREPVASLSPVALACLLAAGRRRHPSGHGAKRTGVGGPPLGPASAVDNVRAGVLLLRSLLNSSGGDPALAAAGYFQGWSSVRQNGMLPSTQQYVNNVMALTPRFGGG